MFFALILESARGYDAGVVVPAFASVDFALDRRSVILAVLTLSTERIEH